MSRRRRIRRQNRLHVISNPAPRDARTSLSQPVVMRVRKLVTPDRVREEILPKSGVINQPVDRLRQRLIIDRARRTAMSRANRLVVQDNKLGLTSVGKYGKLQVDLPHDHPVCVKRRERRQVMFATDKSGQGGQKTPRRPELIVRCK